MARAHRRRADSRRPKKIGLKAAGRQNGISRVQRAAYFHNKLFLLLAAIGAVRRRRVVGGGGGGGGGLVDGRRSNERRRPQTMLVLNARLHRVDRRQRGVAQRPRSHVHEVHHVLPIFAAAACVGRRSYEAAAGRQ